MPEIKSRKYICEVCGSENDITYNRGTIQIENETHETRRCHSCNTVYKYSNKSLYLIPKKIDKPIKPDSVNQNRRKKDTAFGNALVLLLFGGTALIVLVGVYMLINAATPSIKDLGISAKNTVIDAIDDGPQLKLEDDKLYIDHFEYSFGMIEINKPSGNFKELNEKVFDLLNQKTGICTVYIKVRSQDKYGNSSETYQPKGKIDINELNKFKNAELWAKSGGMQSILLN